MKERKEKLKNLIGLNENDFFVVRILQRRKDNPELELGVKQLKVYSFYSWEEFEKQEDRIKEICDLNNARAYIRLNKQNSLDVSYRCVEEMMQNLRNGNAKKNENVWNSVAGKGGSKDWWVVDIDEDHIGCYQSLKFSLHALYAKRYSDKVWNLVSDTDVPEPFHINEWMVENLTKSGVHLICKPFDTRVLQEYNRELQSEGLPLIEIQKDANTVLYIGQPNKNK